MSARGRFFRRRSGLGAVTGPLLLAVSERPGWDPGSVEVVLMDLSNGTVTPPCSVTASRAAGSGSVSGYADVTDGDFAAVAFEGTADVSRVDRALWNVRRQRLEHEEALDHLDRVETQIRRELEAAPDPTTDLDDGDGAPGAGRAG